MVTRHSVPLLACLLALLVACPSAILAQKFQAFLEPDPVTVGDRFFYVVELDAEPLNLKPPEEFSDTAEFVSYFGKKTSASVGPSGTRVNYRYEWSFKALREGPLQFGPATAVINGVTRESNRVSTVVQALPRKSVSGFGDIVPPRSNNPTLDRQLEGAYFSITEVDTEAYVRQPVTIQTYLYRDPETPFTLRNINVGSPFAGPQFIKVEEASGYESGLRWERVDIDGRLFERALIDTTTVVPTRPGTTRVAGREFQIRVMSGRQTRQNFFFDDGIPVLMGPQTRELVVKPLPDPPPGAVAQLVGRFDILTDLDRAELPEGDLLSLTVRAAGWGYLAQEALEAPREIDGLRFIDQEVQFAVERTRAPLATSKEFKLVYMATLPGEHVIPPMAIAMVDPTSGEQTIVQTDPVTVKVTPSGNASVMIGSAAPAASARADRRSIGESDILFIDKTPITSQSEASGFVPLHRRPWFWAAHLAVLAAAVGSIAWSVRRRALLGDPRALRAREARQRGMASLEEARRLAREARAQEFYAALSKGMLNVVGAACGREPSGLTIDEAVDLARGRNIPEDRCAELRHLLERCDHMRYAPVEDAGAREGDLALARELAAVLEKAR
jgi:hypothetical protein